MFSRGNTSGPAYAATAAQLLEFGPDGRFIREIGENLYAWSFGHAVRIDRQDNIWAIDKGSDMIVRFNPEGHVTMVFGRKQEASDESTKPLEHPSPPLPAEDGRFRQPTDVAFGPDGGNKPGELNTPHSIATDAMGNVYVADRGNRRIQVFDGEGKFLRIMTIDVAFDVSARPAIGNKPTLQTYQKVLTLAPGSPWALCITPPPHQVLYASDAIRAASTS